MRYISSLLLIVALVADSNLAAAQTAQPASYLAKGQLNLVTLLPPPPKADSLAQSADEKLVLEKQHHRTSAQMARSTADGEVSVFRFADILGTNFTKDRLPKLTSLFDKINATFRDPALEVKERWNRPRPYLANKKVQPVTGLIEIMLKLNPKASTQSYPSGHAMFGEICAILLSEMVPERASELFQRSREYGENRILGGVHFATDTEAGRTAGAIFVYAIQSNPQFQTDFKAAKTELRTVLGLGK